MNNFEVATRQKLRFASSKGDLTVEQLWDLPLTSRTGFDLDTVAKTVNQALKQVAEESFVAVTTSPVKAQLELKLEIVKHVIAEKMQANAAAKRSAQNAAERQRLMEILSQKKDQALQGESIEDLQKRIDQLAE